MGGAGRVTGKEMLLRFPPPPIQLTILLLMAQQHLVLIIKELLTLTDVIYSASIEPAMQRIKLESMERQLDTPHY